jgi:pyruvate/2-oxoglutarate dehydrogenase complex dihydrolipoamide dehydrogenase (E3) component
VSFLLETAVKEVRRAGGLKEVVVVRAGREEAVRAADILVALGRRANMEGLRLENAGVAVGKKGVTVDARLRTSARHIFAAGDVTGEHQFTHAAGYEGGVVVANAVFRLPRKADYTWLPWCTYADPELASIGLNESRAHAAGHEVRVVTEEFRGNDRALAEGESGGKLKLVLDEKERPLGVQILGLHAGELLGEWSAVLSGGVKLTSLAGAVHAYPTLSEISKRVDGTYLSDKIFSDKVRKILHLLFQTKGRACGPGEGAGKG